MKCFHHQCQKKATFSCVCQNILLCPSHATSHMNLPREHNYKNIDANLEVIEISLDQKIQLMLSRKIEGFPVILNYSLNEIMISDDFIYAFVCK